MILKQLDVIMAKHFGPNLPSISQLEKRVELALINSNPMLGNAGPQPDNVIPIGGMHIKDMKPLPAVSSKTKSLVKISIQKYNLYLIRILKNLSMRLKKVQFYFHLVPFSMTRIFRLTNFSYLLVSLVNSLIITFYGNVNAI